MAAPYTNRPASKMLAVIVREAHQAEALRALSDTRRARSLSELDADPHALGEVADALGLDRTGARALVASAYAERGERLDTDAEILLIGLAAPLAMDVVGTIRVWITSGGPNVWIELDLNRDGEIEDGRLRYCWGEMDDTSHLTQDELTAIVALYRIDRDTAAYLAA